MSNLGYLLPRLFICLIFTGSALAAEQKYPPTPPNVKYGDVLALPFRPADALYQYGEDVHQFAKLWLPANADEVSKLVVFIHGGCWLNQFDMAHTYPLATALSQSGYGVWSLEYRRTGDEGGGWPGGFEDIKDGIAYVSSLSGNSLSSAQLVIVGHSAGGHLALLAGNEFPNVRSVIGLAAISDIQTYSMGNNDCETATPLFMGGTFSELPSLYRSANPVDVGVHGETTLLHGTADSIVNISQSNLTGAKALVEEGAGHFDWVHPGTSATTLLLKTLEEAFD